MIEEASAPSDQPKQIHPLQGLNILLAEDGPDNQVLIRTVLSKAGAEVIVVENGRLAIQETTKQAFDLVLMDMQMPEMDGYEATRRLRAEGYPIPIIALTAHSLSGDRDRCIDAGCSDYLSKPIHRAGMIDVILKHTSPKQPPTVQPALAEQQQRASIEVIKSEFADDQDLREVLHAFVQQLPHRCREIREALNHNDIPTAQRLAYQIKGDGGGYGYPMLTQVGRELENAARASDLETCKLKLAHMETLCRAIEQGWALKTGSSSKT
jgi:CheY-like chemotaxis protein